MTKKALGNLIYKTCLILTTAFLLAILVFYKNEDRAILSYVRYVCCFYSFCGVIPLGLIIREFLLESYLKKKMIIKCVCTGCALILGTVLLLTIKTAQIGLMSMFLGAGILMFVAVPTVPIDEKNN